MLRLDHIRDLDTMRQVAVLLEGENDRLHAKLAALTRDEAEPHYPGPCAEVLDLIGQLYAVERECPARVGAATEIEVIELRDQRARLRAERSAPLVAAIRAWALQQRALPENGLGKAIAYMLGLWPGLTRFLNDPRIPLDNNTTERALRGMVIGRKNHYGSRSKRGTEVAALFYRWP